jgi:hypothetical protein
VAILSDFMNIFFLASFLSVKTGNLPQKYIFFNYILHKLAKIISHQKKSPEAGGYSFTMYKLAMMPRGETSLPHDTCHKTCRETMLY